jgi:L-fuconolactonase
MTIIDSQVHVYEANTPSRPWHSVPNWPDHVTGDEMVAAMDKVGVDGAIFISAFSMYQYDASYAVEVQQAHPGRFAIVKPVNPDEPAVADVIADWKKTPGAVGIRIMLTKEANRAPDDPGLDRIARAAARHDFPVNVLFWGCAVTRRRFPVGAGPTRRFAPAGSNRSSHGGNEMAEAFD